MDLDLGVCLFIASSLKAKYIHQSMEKSSSVIIYISC